jgi:hypothetical protein
MLISTAGSILVEKEVAVGIQLGPVSIDSEALTAEQSFFLERLDHLVALSAQPGHTAGQERLLRQAIYSTYADCRALGVDAAARRSLSRSRPRR